MKKLMLLTSIFMILTVQAQIRRSPVRRTQPSAPISKPALSSQSPIFLSRKDSASIDEMVREPPAFSYGSSINIWFARDNGLIREIGVTGHGDSPTCRWVSGQVMGLFLEKQTEIDDLFVAGAAHIVDRADQENRQRLENDATVKDYLSTVKDYRAADFLVKNYEANPA